MLSKLIIFLLYLSYTNEITNKLQENELKRMEQISIIPEIDNKKSPIKLNKDLNIKSLISREITSDKMEINGNIKITTSSNVDKINVNKLTTENLFIDKINTENKPLTINGNIIIKNEIETEKFESENLIINGVKQFKLIKNDNFNLNSSGWNFDKINKCNNGHFHLGGYCNLAEKEISKKYKNLPKHSFIRIIATYDMIDNWNGEMGYMKIDNIINWAKIGKSNLKNGINFCGDNKFYDNIGEKIDVILEHNNDEVEITFGSTLKGNPCKHSYGIGNVMLYIK